jgi:hypothetical protein
VVQSSLPTDDIVVTLGIWINAIHRAYCTINAVSILNGSGITHSSEGVSIVMVGCEDPIGFYVALDEFFLVVLTSLRHSSTIRIMETEFGTQVCTG